MNEKANSSILIYSAADIERTVFEQGVFYGHAYSMHPTIIRVVPRTKRGKLFDLFTVSPEFKPNIEENFLQPVRCESGDRNVWIKGGMNERTVYWLGLLANAVKIAQRNYTHALARLVVVHEAGDGISMCLAHEGLSICPVYDTEKKKSTVRDNPARLGFFAPIFTSNKQRFDHVSIATPDFEFIKSDAYKHLHKEIGAIDSSTKFEERNSVVLWRGSATETGVPEHTERARAAILSKEELEGGRTWLDVKLTTFVDKTKAMKKLKLSIEPGMGIREQLNAIY
jgi:hypothetical protein